MNWVKRHKFWTSVLALWVVGALLAPDPIMATKFGALLGTYTIIGVVAKLLFNRLKHKEANK